MAELIEVEQEGGYLIRKGDAWYRWEARGYTGSAIQAGRFTLDEAKRLTHPNGPNGPRDGLEYIHEDALTTDPDWTAYRELSTTLATMQAREAELVAEVARLRTLLDGRDAFIVKNALWDDFVASLPRHSNQERVR